MSRPRRPGCAEEQYLRKGGNGCAACFVQRTLSTVMWTKAHDMTPAAGAEPEARVLVADDDGDMRRLVERSLRRSGLSVELVRDGRALLHQLEAPDSADLPDVIVTDVQMPGLSGVDVLHRLRTRGLHLPVILVTAYPHRELAEQAEALGAADVLTKPFRMTDLHASVRRALNGAVCD